MSRTPPFYLERDGCGDDLKCVRVSGLSREPSQEDHELYGCISQFIVRDLSHNTLFTFQIIQENGYRALCLIRSSLVGRCYEFGARRDFQTHLTGHDFER
jgi:hypothetical protein